MEINRDPVHCVCHLLGCKKRLRLEEERMRCVDCPHFCIQCLPIRGKIRGVSGFWDLGHARCNKHNLVVDFASKKKLEKLTCVKEDKDEKTVVGGR